MMPAVGYDDLTADLRTIYTARVLDGPKPPANPLARLIKSSYALLMVPVRITPQAPRITPPKTERNAAVYAAHLKGLYTNSEIGLLFGIGESRVRAITAREGRS